MKATIKKIIISVCIVIAVLFTIVCISLFVSLVKYTNQVPKITPKADVVVHVGDEVELLDVFDVECKGEYYLKMNFESSDAFVVEMSEDKQSFVAKEKAENVVIYVYGSGENAELVSSKNTITIE